jgi:HTH-like domain
LDLLDWEDSELSIKTQVELLNLNRTSLYYKPVEPSSEERIIKHRIDELYTKYPFFGSRRIKEHLEADGLLINRKAVQRHMRELEIEGIHDAPAIATADIGLAMGEGGTDISMETADVVLMADKLMQFSHAYSLSKATIRNMKQNTYFAVSIVFVLLLGVLNGSVHLVGG